MESSNTELNRAVASADSTDQPKPKKKPRVAAQGGDVASSKAKSSSKANNANKAGLARSKGVAIRPDSKAAKLLDLLKRPNGATLKELMRASRWQAHSVRGFLSAQIRKRMGLKLRSFEREGERVYAVNR